MAERRPKIGVTTGDAAGIGPEISIKAIAGQKGSDFEIVLIGDEANLRRQATQISYFGPLPSIHDVGSLPGEIVIGTDDATTGKASAQNIEAAIELWKRGEIDAIATAPISKKAISLAGYDFPGHTEFLAALTGTDDFRMSFFAGKLRTVLLSTHVSLTQAISLVTTGALIDLIRFTDREMSKLLGRRVSIAVAGLNPHASESGMFGHEEAEHIMPAISECAAEGINVSGPYSPDTIFLRGYKGDFDAVVALYHDQATVAVKSLSFGSGVNVTLGLPLIRTSVDHGTAYDIAGKNIADASSMLAAIELASDLVKLSPNYK